MPESFDGMLAELADAAAAGVTMPDLADVRRRARQRTVHRRMTASAVAFALLCVSGVAGAAIDGRFRPPSKISPVSAPSASAGPLGATPAPGTGTSTADPAASAAAGPYYAAFAGLWVSKPTGDYVIVFPDGVVGLGQDGGFPLCYGQGQAATSASPAADSAAESSALSGGSGAGATPSSLATVPTVASGSTATAFLSTLPFSLVACADDTGLQDGLTLETGQGAETLSLLDAATEAAKAKGYAETYTRAVPIGAAHAGTDPAVLARLVGQWVATDGTKRVLDIAGDGSVDYTAAGLSIESGSGEIDAYYGTGARVLTGCTAAQKSLMAKDQGGDFIFAADQVCGVLLIEYTANDREITVFTGTGQEEFLRVD